MDAPCLQGALVPPGATPALTPGCNMYESLAADGGTRTEKLLTACEATAASDPCWTLQSAAACTGSGVAIGLQRSTPAPTGAAILVRCGG